MACEARLPGGVGEGGSHSHLLGGKATVKRKVWVA